jgi:hypothetical protein
MKLALSVARVAPALRRISPDHEKRRVDARRFFVAAA